MIESLYDKRDNPKSYMHENDDKIYRSRAGTGTLLPFRYPGGKFYAIKHLRKYWQAVPHDEYREPMMGGGAVFFAKNKVRYNWINDLDTELIKTYKTMADPKLRYKLVEAVKNEIASKDRHKEVKDFQPTNDFEIAFKYYYLNRTSFSGKMVNPSWGYRPVRSLPPHRWSERIIPCGKKLENVKITSIDFEEVIRAPSKVSRVLMFIDPPYYKINQSNHYRCGFSLRDHERLAQSLQETDYNFFLTYDDCVEVRELYNWANIYPLKFFYRIDNSQDQSGKRRKGNELVVTNYEILKISKLTNEDF